MPNLSGLSIQIGPSKFELMLSLFDWKPMHRWVTFNAGNTLYNVSVTSVEAEDGSGESWSIKGSAVRQGTTTRRDVTIYFRTDRRTGHLTFLN